MGTVLIAGLVASPSAKAGPRENVANARLCLVNNGWRTLTTLNGGHFRNVAGCLVYALLGGKFAPTTPTTPPTPPTGGGGVE